MNVSTTYFDPLIGADIATLIQPNTRVVFLESPAPSPWKCGIFRRWCGPSRAVAPEVVIMIDNTWAAGVLFKALDFDIDISIQAGTKYLIGHFRLHARHRRRQRALLGSAARVLPI